MADAISPLEELRTLLRSRLRITEALVLSPRVGTHHARHVVASPKIILLRAGRIQYHINGRVVKLSPGDLLFRPAGSVAQWEMPPDRPTAYSFCEFVADPPWSGPAEPLLRTDC